MLVTKNKIKQFKERGEGGRSRLHWAGWPSLRQKYLSNDLMEVKEQAMQITET